MKKGGLVRGERMRFGVKEEPMQRHHKGTGRARGTLDWV